MKHILFINFILIFKELKFFKEIKIIAYHIDLYLE